MRLAFQIAIQSGVPVLFTGPPGVGKTKSTEAFARALALPCEVVIASVREPADFAGLPIVTSSGVILEAPAWAKRLFAAGRGLLFLDEITTAPPAVQAALLRVILDRAVGDLTLSLDVWVIGACNPPEQAAGGWDLSAPLANRFCHLTWALDSRAWCDGMVAGWPPTEVRRLPEGWQDVFLFASRTLVASFIKHRPALLLQVPKEEVLAGKAWPSPRSWDMAAMMMAACDSVGANKDIKIELVTGCVSEGPAIEFVNWTEELDLPDPELVLKDPDSFKLPNRGDRAYAALAAIASAVINKNTPARWVAGWKVMAKAYDKGAADIAGSAALLLARNRPAKATPPPETAKFAVLLKAAGIMP